MTKFSVEKVIDDTIKNHWRDFFLSGANIKLCLGAYYKTINTALSRESLFYPPRDQIFAAFRCELPDIRVVILGQDPYIGPGQANGLAFSCAAQPLPPTLKNIFKEIAAEYPPDPSGGPRTRGDLSDWAAQGVLLLNSVLTVAPGKSGSHFGIGWEGITDKVIKLISMRAAGVIFMLWGAAAQKKAALIDSDRHFILKSGHPSPLSAARYGFFGCGHFRKCNELLAAQGKSEIKWI